MIEGILKYPLEEALKKSNSLLMRYGGGKLPEYKVAAFALACWFGFKVSKLPPNDKGIQLIVLRSMSEGLSIQYSETLKDIDYAVFHAVALEVLGYLQWDTPHKEYVWGNLLTDMEKMATKLFVQDLIEAGSQSAPLRDVR